MIEITESGLGADDQRQMEETLADLNRHGLKFAIDDFGTGYSSLGRLNNGWVSMLKVDRSFVRDMTVDAHACKLVEAVTQLARTLDLVPLAEGVETEAQRRLLLAAGFSLGQGFLMCRPLPVEELERFLDGALRRLYAA
jgi:EAL domain-containing protein (putative c-di-GMP-specific phosphodiesterase class I)